MTDAVGVPVARARPPWVNQVTDDAIQHFVWGTGDNNPLWVDRSDAVASPWGDMIAPPSFLYAVDETTVAPGHEDLRRLYISVDWSWFDVIRVGTTIETEAALVHEAEEPAGLVQTGRVVFTAAGRELARAETRCLRLAGEAPAIDERPEISYTATELEQFEHSILSESRTGAGTVSVDEVRPGDSLGPMIKGPLSIMDIVAWCAGSQGVIADNTISEGGLHTQSATGPEQVAWMVQLITDWMGDGGFLHRFRAEVLSNPPLGSTTRITATVAQSVETPAPGVEVDVIAADQHGQSTAVASAVVLLPSEPGETVQLPLN